MCRPLALRTLSPTSACLPSFLAHGTASKRHQPPQCQPRQICLLAVLPRRAMTSTKGHSQDRTGTGTGADILHAFEYAFTYAHAQIYSNQVSCDKHKWSPPKSNTHTHECTYSTCTQIHKHRQTHIHFQTAHKDSSYA